VAEEEVTFIIDSIAGDPISLQQDFLPFNFKSSNDRRFEASDSDLKEVEEKGRRGEASDMSASTLPTHRNAGW
jgi:hypothetical protein